MRKTAEVTIAITCVKSTHMIENDIQTSGSAEFDLPNACHAAVMGLARKEERKAGKLQP